MFIDREKNEMIAEFMGLRFQKEIDGVKYYSVPTGHVESYNASQGYFKYSRSWDWLMPVVLKIESLGQSVIIDTLGVHLPLNPLRVKDGKVIAFQIPDDGNKLEVVYRAVVEFIEWYNQYGKE